jgi:hypothetical protein
MKLSDRVAALEERLAALEGPPTPGSTGPTGPTGPTGEVFWVLEGLRERHPGPGAVVLAGTVRLPDDRTLEWQEGLDTDALLGQDWREAAELLAALGHPVRLALVQRFLGGAATVAEATAPVGEADDGFGTSGQVYHHLRQLVAAGWLRSTGGGRYEVPPQRVVPLMSIALGAHR